MPNLVWHSKLTKHYIDQEHIDTQTKRGHAAVNLHDVYEVLIKVINYIKPSLTYIHTLQKSHSFSFMYAMLQFLTF